jgi:hypothetical protein
MKKYTLKLNEVTATITSENSTRVGLLNDFLLSFIGINSKKFLLNSMRGEDNRMSEMTITDEDNNVIN